MTNKLKQTDEVERTLRRDRVKFLGGQATLSLLYSPLGAALLTVATWGSLPNWKLVIFNLGIALVSVIRFLVQRSLPNDIELDASARIWEKWLVVANFSSASWWGLWGLFLVQDAQLEARLIYFSGLMMLSAAGSLRYALHPAAAISWPLAMGVPVITYFAWGGDRTLVTVALSGTFFVVSLLQATDQIAKLFARTYTLSHSLDAERHEVRQVNLELQESYRELERLDNLRETLSQMIVHDLRSPLSSSAFYLDLARDSFNKEDKEGHEYLNKLEKLTWQMSNMVENILDVRTLEQDSLKLAIGEHSFPNLVREAMDKLGPVSSRVNTKGMDEVCLRCDGELLSRVILNLLSNALRFSPQDKPIELVACKSNKCFAVSVIDQGVGIPPEKQDDIFEKFVHGPTPQGRHRSKGLGLAFCKLVVESHGGRIGVVSSSDQSTRFWFELPLG